MASDVDRLLAKESSLFNTVYPFASLFVQEAKLRPQDREIDRIMSSFILDPYSVLDIQPGVPPEEIKKVFRKKSLLIHPDKTKNPRASDAFDRLKKAEAELMDDKKRGSLDSLIAAARKAVIKEQNLDENTDYIKGDRFWIDVREMTKKFLIDDELRRRRARKLQMEQEGRERQEAEDAANEAKRKRDAEKEWEATRESRIDNWRNFSKTGPEKKRKKMKVLG
jgi:DnaJ family protein C protein 8